MAAFGFLILFSLYFPCEGKVQKPSNGTRLIFLPGSTKKIVWSYVGDFSELDSRYWYFNSHDGSRTGRLARVIDDGNPGGEDFSLIPRFKVEKPATLVLQKVDQRYNGIYTFDVKLKSSRNFLSSEVAVFIAKKPNVTLNSSSPVILNDGEDFICECTGLGGNPPASVIWYKDGKQIGETGTEKQILTLMKVDEIDSATYKCVAESYPNAMYKDEKSIRVNVHFKPKDTSIKFEPDPAILGDPVTITCDSRGFPKPSYTISHNGTHLINAKTYTDNDVAWSGTGVYKCFAKNERGNASASDVLKVTERGPTTTTPPNNIKQANGQGEGDGGGLGVGPIIGIVIGVLVLLVIVIVVVWRYKLKEKDRRRVNRNVNPNEKSENVYDMVMSKSNPQTSTLPVYAAVDKNNSEGKPLYVTLDTVAMNSDDSKRRSEESKPEPTQYASIDFERSGEVPRADLV